MGETEDKPRVVQADFTEKDVIKFMRAQAALAKSADVRSVFIMTVTSSGHCSWNQLVEGEHHCALMCLTLEDAREDLKALIFGEEPV